MFQARQFRTEFVRQSQAMILPRVTMAQFYFIFGAIVLSAALIKSPLVIPVALILGWLAGYSHNGALIARRALAISLAWVRQTVRQPKLVDVQKQWEAVDKRERDRV